MTRDTQVTEANLRLFCLKTQIAFVRNVSGPPFPAALRNRARQILGEQIAGDLRTLLGAQDVTNDDDLAAYGAAYHGLTPREERRVGYRLLRVDRTPLGTPVWCELMGANHCTFSVCDTSLDFEARTEALRLLVDGLAKPLRFVYDRRLGYVTAQPALMGTGFRIRSWMHLAGLSHFGYLTELCNAAEAMRALAEPYRPEDAPPGNLMILFNRFSMDARAQTLAGHFKAFLMRVAEQETEARWRLLHDEPFVFVDILKRAKAILKNASLISADEALDLLSDLRLGLTCGAATLRKADPLAPHWFDDATDAAFYPRQGRALRRTVSLPHDVATFRPWRNDALRAQWLRPLAAFAIDRDLIERADSQ